MSGMDSLKSNMRKGLLGATVSAVGAGVGGLIGGPIGMAVGGTVGGVIAATVFGIYRWVFYWKLLTYFDRILKLIDFVILQISVQHQKSFKTILHQMKDKTCWKEADEQYLPWKILQLNFSYKYYKNSGIVKHWKILSIKFCCPFYLILSVWVWKSSSD